MHKRLRDRVTRGARLPAELWCRRRVASPTTSYTLEDLGLEPSYVVMTAGHVGDPLWEILGGGTLYTLEFITNRSAAPALTYIDNILTPHAKLKYGIQFSFFGHS